MASLSTGQQLAILTMRQGLCVDTYPDLDALLKAASYRHNAALKFGAGTPTFLRELADEIEEHNRQLAAEDEQTERNDIDGPGLKA